MPIYEYTALNPKGQTKKSCFHADSMIEAKESLLKQELFLVAIKESKGSEKGKKLSKEQVLLFTQELSQLLKAKLPLYEALKTLEENNTNHPSHRIIAYLCDHVKQGELLSVALKAYPHLFDPVYIAMVKAGEESGKMDSAFLTLKKILSKQLKLQKQLSSALTYPKFLASFGFLLVLGVFYFLIPALKEMIEDKTLNNLTLAVLKISSLLRDQPYSCLVFLGFLVCFFAFFKRIPGVLGFWYYLQIHFLPLKRFFIPKAFSRFCETLAGLLAANVPLVDAMRFSKDVLAHPILEKEIERILDQVVLGKKLSYELKHSPYIPDLVSKLVATSEETGTLAETFSSIAEIYEEELEKNLSQLSTLIQPVMIVILGLIIGLVLLAVLIPMTDVSNFLI